MRLAIIMCSFNRKEYTKRCISKLIQSSEQIAKCNYAIYVCDDASTDGTREMIVKLFPKTVIIESPGNLYWCKSMYRAMKRAQSDGYDYYLMVNDDVDFSDNVVEVMLQSYEDAGMVCGIVGNTKAVNSEECTYGGRDMEEKLVIPNGKIQKAMWANWNCFLVSNNVLEKIGIIDGKYQHAWGDFDYSYRMYKADIPLYVATDYVGRCDNNSPKGTYSDPEVSKISRLKKLFGPKGMPFYSYMRYHIMRYGKTGIVTYLWGYLSIIFYILMGREVE